MMWQWDFGEMLTVVGENARVEAESRSHHQDGVGRGALSWSLARASR